MPVQLTRLVISLMSTGATLFDRNFLWTQRKLISTIRWTLRELKSSNNSKILYEMKKRKEQHISGPLLRHGSFDLHLPIIHFDVGRHSTDEPDQLFAFSHSYSTMPVFQPARGFQGPVHNKPETSGILLRLSSLPQSCHKATEDDTGTHHKRNSEE